MRVPKLSTTGSASLRSRSFSSSGIVRRSSSAAKEPTGPLFTSSSSTQGSSPSASPTLKRRAYGQALPHTHPHLFPRRPAFPAPSTQTWQEAGTAHTELTPGIEAEEYAQRRRALMRRLPEKSVVLVMAGRVKNMSGNILSRMHSFPEPRAWVHGAALQVSVAAADDHLAASYRFRQDSNFWYLTGFQEPDAALLLEADSSSEGYKMTMFVQPRDEVNELWNGPRTGIDGAQDIFGAHEAYAMEPASLLAHLKAVLPSYNHIYYDAATAPSIPRASSRTRAGSILNFLAPPSPTGLDVFDRKTDFEGIMKLLGDSRKVHALAPHMDALRVIKSDAELRIMKRAGDASAAGMRAVMQFAAPGRTEAQVQATFEHATALRGAQRPAYVPVVASGANALTIHYVANEDVLKDGDLVCIDAGGEMDGYVSDITRAFPISGRFSSPQADLYSAVLRVLRACTKLCTASTGFTQGELHRRSVELLRTELKELGFDVNRAGIMDRLYPHSLSHWLGIDLHDTPSVDRGTRLKSGHVLTIEPALYIPFDDAFPKAFQGLGIRIEDDVAVRQEDNVILSAEAPREIEDVEALCTGFWDAARAPDEGLSFAPQEPIRRQETAATA